MFHYSKEVLGTYKFNTVCTQRNDNAPYNITLDEVDPHEALNVFEDTETRN